MSADKPWTCGSCTQEVAEDDVYLHYEGARVVCLRCFHAEEEHETPTAHNWRQGHDSAVKPLEVRRSVCVRCGESYPASDMAPDFGLDTHGQYIGKGLCVFCGPDRRNGMSEADEATAHMREER